ncbi:hypothetical protein D9M70_433490 [compost metagenome]
MAQSQRLPDHAADRNAAEMRLRDFQRVHHCDHIIGQPRHGVGPQRRLAAAMPAQVGAHHAVARRQVGGGLVPQRMAGGQRMGQDHPWSVGAVDAHVKLGAVGMDAVRFGGWRGNSHGWAPVSKNAPKRGNVDPGEAPFNDC